VHLILLRAAPFKLPFLFRLTASSSVRFLTALGMTALAQKRGIKNFYPSDVKKCMKTAVIPQKNLFSILYNTARETMLNNKITTKSINAANINAAS